ncbi:MAG: hypothetical protein M1454_01155 [Candidatus Thermoplasmatota archaeon]|nr:hypothetical protein [Candidatus Thermoplasmatota archaeon]MCL5731138.1 hypothetical protein [Candidatus Thermoplasmatota archaeon]
MSVKFFPFYGTEREFLSGFSSEALDTITVDKYDSVLAVTISGYQQIFRLSAGISDQISDKLAEKKIKYSILKMDASRFMPESVRNMFSDNPSHLDITRRNIIEMVDTAIFTFLKTLPSVRTDSSEIDSIFKAKHDLLLGMIPELEKGWRDLCEATADEIRKMANGKLAVVINLEMRYALEPKFE